MMTILPRWVDYTIERYNRVFNYKFDLIYEKPESVVSLLDENTIRYDFDWNLMFVKRTLKWKVVW
jgi:hypothetical protein